LLHLKQVNHHEEIRNAIIVNFQQKMRNFPQKTTATPGIKNLSFYLEKQSNNQFNSNHKHVEQNKIIPELKEIKT